MPAPVSLSQGPPTAAFTNLNAYDGSNNLEYTGVARSFQPNPVTLTVVSVSKANPAVVTVTGHGLASDNTVDISGTTGDWTAIDGSQKITVTGTDTFTIAVNTSAYSGTYAGTMTTNSPQTGAAVWAIQKFYYDASNNLTRSAWANGSPAMNAAWSSRATAKYL
jgi:hypothetical protein